MDQDKINYDNQKVRRIGLLILMDGISLFLSYLFSFFLVYSFVLPFSLVQEFALFLSVAILIKIVVFAVTRMYNTLWRYASIEELWQIVGSVVVANLVILVLQLFFGVNIPTSVVILSAVFDLLFVGGIRILYRTARLLRNTGGLAKKPVLVVGAGDAGVKMLREINNSKQGMSVIGFVDDDPNKKGRRMNGTTIIGDRNDIADFAKSNNLYEIIIAMPTAPKKQRVQIAKICQETGVPVKVLPTIEDILNYDVKEQKLRDLQIEDLLDRDEVTLDKKAISKTISGKRVLVTGGAGSIGSELCRQIIRFNPSELIVLDINENALYFLELELQRYLREKKEKESAGYFKEIKLTMLIASIRERDTINELFAKCKPEMVYHAAAHKHVPLMERTPREAVKNNVFGTINVLDACINNNVQRFTQISTDKAVNPTNVMGATKRICEIMVQIYNERCRLNPDCETEFVAVRFGNVLGSNGSVIPIFKEQIANGGPVTVTHKDITRFFMTIPEATQLVLQASSMARGGEIFVLDMGEPEKITELAEKMIKLSGYEPYTEIPIKFVGLRPGEKLYEELSYDLEAFDKTTFESIFVEKPVTYENDKIKTDIEILWNNVNLNGTTEQENIAIDEKVVEGIKMVVPEFNRAKL